LGNSLCRSDPNFSLVDDSTIPFRGGFKIGEKLFPVTKAFENCLSLIAPGSNMIESAGELYP
jgi:hypothetical protein